MFCLQLNMPHFQPLMAVSHYRDPQVGENFIKLI